MPGCVEIDLQKLLRPFIAVMGTLQPVEYEELHQIWFGCGKYGHKQEFCSIQIVVRDAAVIAGTLPCVQALVVAEPNMVEKPLTGKDFGPWMIPKFFSLHKESDGYRDFFLGDSVQTDSKNLGGRAT